MSEKMIATLSQQLSCSSLSFQCSSVGTRKIKEYWLQLPPKEVLQAKLHKAIEEATLRLEVGDE